MANDGMTASVPEPTDTANQPKEFSMLSKLLDAVPSRFWTRHCAGCSDLSPHSHHLTAFGRWYFTRGSFG